jgi:hypothetical protein
MNKRLILVVLAALGLAFGLMVYLASPEAAQCESWACHGSCAGPGTCPAYGCVCVGYTQGAGRCVSQ